MLVKMKSAALKIMNKVQATVRRKVTDAAISVRCWTFQGKAALNNTSGAGAAMDIALGLVAGIVLILIVLTALKNLFNVDIMPQVTNKIDSMWS